jgi:HAD superfamily hydrolase (TIGR01509 family)
VMAFCLKEMMRKMITKIDAILFDFDGTLIDTEHLYLSILSDLLVEMGYQHYSLDKCYELFAGCNDHTIISSLMKQNLNFDLTTFKVSIYESIEEAIKSGLKSIDGAEEVIIAANHLNKAIVTNGTRDLVMFNLEMSGLSKHFNDGDVFTVEMVSNGKPEPDLYNLACAKKNLNKSTTLVIEDSVVGAKASIAAGLKTLGFVNAKKQDINYYNQLEAKFREIGVYDIIYSLKDSLKYF